MRQFGNSVLRKSTEIDDVPSVSHGEKEGGEDNDEGVSLYFHEEEEEYVVTYVDSDDSLQND